MEEEKNNNITKYPHLIDGVAKKIFKNKIFGKEYTAKILSTILNEDYKTVYNSIKLISEDISFSPKTVKSAADVMLEDDSILVNIEINYFNGPTKVVQMNSYVCQLYVGQLATYKDYPNIKKVIQIILEDQDFFHKNQFVYDVVFMERKYHIVEDDNIEKFRINLDYLSKMTYNDIERNELAKLLYLFVCGDDNLVTAYNNLYKDDDFMKKVVDEVKKMAKTDGVKLFFPLTDEEVRQYDEQFYINQGIKQGIEQGIQQGIQQGIEQGIQRGIEQGSDNTKKAMIVELNNNGISLDIISKSSGLSIDEVKKIINNPNE